MDVSVRTGMTAAERGTHLSARHLTSVSAEPVCVLMEVTGAEDASKTVQYECENIIRHALLEAEGEASERLDSTLKELNGLMKGMRVSGVVSDLQMIIAVLDAEQVLHISHAGRAEAYLVRGAAGTQITKQTGKPMPAFIHIASGDLQAGDRVILSTQRLLRTFTFAQIARMTQQESDVLGHIEHALVADGDYAALALIQLGAPPEEKPRGERSSTPAPRRRSAGSSIDVLRFFRALPIREVGGRGWNAISPALSGMIRRVRDAGGVTLRTLAKDLHHPQRRKRAHLLILASAIGLLIVVWAAVQLTTVSQRSKTRAELENLMQQVEEEIQTAENRNLIGDAVAANANLALAEEHTKEIIDNESGLFKVQGLNLLDKINAKKEEINNIVRLSPRVIANISTKKSDIVTQGFVAIKDGDFVVYDPRDSFRILLNSVENPQRISEDALLRDAAVFSRFQSVAFMTNSNSVIECDWTNCQAVAMKTDDPRGWINGTAIAAYLRYLYVLWPEKNQILKYERLNNRYGAPVEYNVGGDLSSAIDMTIDGSVYVLKTGGAIVKLFRGEPQPFTVVKAPVDLLKGATRIAKAPERNIFLLDPSHKRVIVLSDTNQEGKSTYIRQYVLEGDQVGELKDIAVDSDESHLFILDEKRLYEIDLTVAPLTAGQALP